MGLSSLIKVAQGKNAANVSFEDAFLKGYEAAVVKYEEEHKQPIPADYFRPSSMYGCERMLYFMRTGEEQDKEEHDINLKAVQEKGLDEKSYGGNSALMKAFCDKAVPLCKKAECTFLMINQLRENIGNMYKPYKIPCGTAIAHACSQILWFTKGSLLDEKGDEKSSTYSDPVGNVVNVRVEKNKVTKNDRRLDSYTLNYFRGVDDGTDTIDLGIKLGVIEQSNSWFKVPVSDGSEKKLQGRAGVINYFYNDLDEFDWLKAKVNEVAIQ